MTQNYLSLALMVSALALAGCSKNQTDETQNPDGTAAVDGSNGSSSDDGTPSRARTSTAPRGKKSLTKARRVTASKPPRAPTEGVPEDTGPNGLLVEAFALDSADALPDFSTLTEVAQTFEVPNLDFDETMASEGFPGLTALQSNYALRFSGTINVLEEAEYELCLHSDDGSQLLLEDTLVVDNDGVHDGPVETCELVYLAPGEYKLAVHYFQADGELLAMHFAWGINGGDRVIVPPEVLFEPVDPAAPSR